MLQPLPCALPRDGVLNAAHTTFRLHFPAEKAQGRAEGWVAPWWHHPERPAVPHCPLLSPQLSPAIPLQSLCCPLLFCCPPPLSPAVPLLFPRRPLLIPPTQSSFAGKPGSCSFPGPFPMGPRGQAASRVWVPGPRNGVSWGPGREATGAGQPLHPLPSALRSAGSLPEFSGAGAGAGRPALSPLCVSEDV